MYACPTKSGLLKNKWLGKGTPTKVACAECTKMCTGGERI